jgi:DNA (cytosine-5)-methyltransferase 1
MKTIELFAGVGGFRLGLEKVLHNNLPAYEIIWSNQWEPSTKAQHASDVYVSRFGKNGHSNKDISKVIEDDFQSIPNHDLLVGGFPCQDYSVAKTLSHAAGIVGKKGVLWWSIHGIVQKKGKDAPDYLMLENVDRLLKSPSTQRGRDFAIMLASLSDLGYIVEWRVVNSADYGMPQRRKRVYIMAYKKQSTIHQKFAQSSPEEWILESGVMHKAFPKTLSQTKLDIFEIKGDLAFISEDKVNYNAIRRPFETIGLMVDRKVYTGKATAVYEGPFTVLKDILVSEEEVASDFFISHSDMKKWEYLKGGKKEPRATKSGHCYFYSEGPVTFPDDLNKASRTIVTGEGGKTPSRFKHVIKTESGRYRRLTPVELERLNMFPDNHTNGATDTKRAFFMGNALVVGVIEKLGTELMLAIRGHEAQSQCIATIKQSNKNQQLPLI